MIGKALLSAPTSVKASLPAAVEGNPDISSSSIPVQKVDAVPGTKAEMKEAASTEPSPTVNSVPIAEVQEESIPVMPRPLSPYPYVNPKPCMLLHFLACFLIILIFPHIQQKIKCCIHPHVRVSAQNYI